MIASILYWNVTLVFAGLQDHDDCTFLFLKCWFCF